MATQPYKFIDRRGANSGWSHFASRVIGFADAAKVSVQREQFLRADKDSIALVASEDRKQLMTVGRYLYERDMTVKPVLNQMAGLASSIVTPQYDGDDLEWGTAAESWLYENDRWIDVRGWPYTMSDQDFLILLHIIRDGDVGELLTEDEFGNPKTQLIPAHRIGTRTDLGARGQKVQGGQFDGATIIDGVIVGDSMQAIGYRVLGDTLDQDRDFSTNDMRLHFKPYWSDQVRGRSWIGASAIGIQDVHESRRLELIAQKKLAGTDIIEHNETGGPSMMDAVILTPGTESTSTADATAPVYSRAIEGGETRYFRAGSNSKLEVLTGDRPTVNQREFSADIVRNAIHAIGWSVDYSLDPTKAGGAQMRIVIENCNRTLDMLRGITTKRRKWVDAWRIAKAVKNGWLPENRDWWKWEYQFAARLTADKKYDSEVDINEMTSGVGTQQDACARRGSWWQDINKQKEREVRDKMTRAKSIADDFGITIQEAMVHLGMLHPMELISSMNKPQGGQAAEEKPE